MVVYTPGRMLHCYVGLVVVTAWNVAGQEQPRVVTPSGTFFGHQYPSVRQERQIYAFTSIPYAKAPVGHLRFAKPEPYGAHSTPFNATGTPPTCLQWDNLRSRGAVGQEDCLYLNVYTNTIPEPPDFLNTQPVLVFLGAGTWTSGSGADGLFQPDYMLESDVAVVTINHRLGPFGFLSTEDGEAPGNFGLMDQVRALEWIRDNIRYFGGMNDSVTVMGSGAGGMSAHMLLLSPWTRGASIRPDSYAALMHKAISQSGTAYSPHAIVRNARANALKLGLRLGCPTDSSRQLVDCLRSIAWDKIVDQMPSMHEWDEEPVPFGPVVDRWQESQAFLPDQPHHLIRRQEFLQLPWIVGTNRDDGAFRVQDILKDPSLTEQLNQHWEKYGPVLLGLTNYSCKDPVDIAKTIRQYYLGKKKFGEESSKEFVEMMTDRFFLYPTDQAAKDYCYYLKGEFCFRYELAYSGRRSFLDILHQESPQEVANSMFGAGMFNPRFQNTRGSHGWGVSFLDELLFLFPSTKLDLTYKRDFRSDSASRVSTHMIMLWTNFIKGSDPTPLMKGWPVDVSPWGAWWEPFVRGYLYYLQIDPEMESKEVPLRDEQMTFWHDLPLFENRDNNVIRDEL